MARLFAENFLTPSVESSFELPEPVYDEQRALNLDAEGQVFVERATVGDTHTLTEVRAEREDHDPEDGVLGQLGTTTKATGEREDVVAAETALGTDTRRGAENEDRDLQTLLGTETAVTAEHEDATPENVLGTRTGAPGESEDFIAGEAFFGTEARAAPENEDLSDHAGWAVTHTFIEREGEDFQPDEVALDGRGEQH